MDFQSHWTLATCLLSNKTLKDISGQYLLKGFFLQNRRDSFYYTAPAGPFPFFPVWDPIQKVTLGHLTLDYNNELTDKNCYNSCSIRLRSPFILSE